MPNGDDRRDGWLPCEPGALQALGAQRQAIRRQAQRARWATAAGVALAMTLGGIYISNFARQANEQFFGGISCHEVQQHHEAYTKGTIPAELANRIEAHLRECPECQRWTEGRSKPLAFLTSWFGSTSTSSHQDTTPHSCGLAPDQLVPNDDAQIAATSD